MEPRHLYNLCSSDYDRVFQIVSQHKLDMMCAHAQQLFIWPSCTLCWTNDSCFLHATASMHLRAWFINSPLNHKMQTENGTQQSISMLEVTKEPSMYLNQGSLSQKSHFLPSEYALGSSLSILTSWACRSLRRAFWSVVYDRSKGRHLSGDTSISLSRTLPSLSQWFFS
jgi:hypothetical protein